MTPVAAGADLFRARRDRELDALATSAAVDLLVVGGGVTGVGVALDAATRGLTVALVERNDLASGTSSFSSKLVHGGMRYLAHAQLHLALESARERAILLRTAPHLVRPLAMLVPSTAHLSHADAALVRLGCTIADGLRAAAGTSRRVLPGPRGVDVAEARRLAPGLEPAGLRGGTLFHDGQLEDDARLVVALARTAAAADARILTRCRAVELCGGGAVVDDTLTGQRFEIRARRVINATGVWAGDLAPDVRLRPSRGAHLILRPESLGHPQTALFVPVPGHRGRFVFALPRSDGLVLLGLTDDEYDGPRDDPPVTAEDERFLLGTMSSVLHTPLEPADVVGRFAGLRPLLASAEGSTADLSRRHAVTVGADGLVTVTGGKLTTYRLMAEDAVDTAVRGLGSAQAPCRTKRWPVIGAASRDELRRLAGVLPARLVNRYGAEAPRVAALARHDPRLLRPLVPGIPVLGVEVLFAVRCEGALDVGDVLDRRTRAGLVPSHRAALEPLVAELAETAVPAR